MSLHESSSADNLDLIRDRVWEIPRDTLPLLAQMDSRKIRGPSGYAHPSIFPTSCAMALASAWPDYPIPSGQLDLAAKHFISVGRAAYNLDSPRYFVGRELLSACEQTKLDVGSMLLSDISWPLGCMCMYLPLGHVMTPSDDDLLLAGFALCGEGYGEIGGIRMAFDIMPTSPSVIFFGQARTGSQFTASGCLDSTVLSLAKDHYDPGAHVFTHETRNGTIVSHITGRTSSVEADSAFLGRMVSLVVRLVLAATTSHDLVENGTIVKPRKVSKGRDHPAEWSPNFLGRQFRLKREPLPGDEGNSVTAHWRLGHFRRQRFGEGNRLSKTIWIEPTLVIGA